MSYRRSSTNWTKKNCDESDQQQKNGANWKIIRFFWCCGLNTPSRFDSLVIASQTMNRKKWCSNDGESMDLTATHFPKNIKEEFLFGLLNFLLVDLLGLFFPYYCRLRHSCRTQTKNCLQELALFAAVGDAYEIPLFHSIKVRRTSVFIAGTAVVVVVYELRLCCYEADRFFLLRAMSALVGYNCSGKESKRGT